MDSNNNNNNIRIPRVEYADVVYVIDGAQIITADGAQIITGDGTQIITGVGSQIITGDGTQIITGAPMIEGAQVNNQGLFPESGQIIEGSYSLQGAQLVNDTQSSLFSTNSINAPGLPGIESASMGPSSNQPIILNSVSYVPDSYMSTNSSYNTNSSIKINNNDHDYSIMTTTSGDVGYSSIGHSGLPEDVELQFDTPPEMADVENVVFHNMPEIPSLDLNNIDLDLYLGSADRFPGLDIGSSDLSQVSPILDSAVNTNVNSGAVPPITIRTKKIRKPRQKVIKEELTPITISNTSYPPLEMLGISTLNTNQASNDTFKYNTSVPYMSPIYQEDSLSAMSDNSPVSPSTSTSTYGSEESTLRRPRVNLATMTDTQRYRHIREQNNESSRAYRERKKMNLKESEAELLLLQERNTRLKEVCQNLTQKKDLAHRLMKGFVRDCSNRRNM